VYGAGPRSRSRVTAPALGARGVRNRGRATEGVSGYYRVFDDGPACLDPFHRRNLDAVSELMSQSPGRHSL